jgi:hypothetical protein
LIYGVVQRPGPVAEEDMAENKSQPGCMDDLTIAFVNEAVIGIAIPPT